MPNLYLLSCARVPRIVLIILAYCKCIYNIYRIVLLLFINVHIIIEYLSCYLLFIIYYLSYYLLFILSLCCVPN